MAALFDKLLFGVTLLIALQIPQLSDQYQQFLSGLYQSTKWQVQGYEATAIKHDYPNVNAMIEHHLQNDVQSVRTDAQQKQVTLQTYEKLSVAMRLFEQGNLFSKTVYMFNPQRYHYLQQTLVHFTPGIPLTMSGILFGIIGGLILNYLLILPFKLTHTWLKQRKTLHHETR